MPSLTRHAQHASELCVCMDGCVGLMNFHENKEIHHRVFAAIVRVEVNLYGARSFYHLTNPTAAPTRPLFSDKTYLLQRKERKGKEKEGRKTLVHSAAGFYLLFYLAAVSGIYSNFPAVELSAHPFSSA